MNILRARLAKKNAEKDPASLLEVYESEVIKRIRTRYTVNQELAILRQRDTKPQEFAEYNEFVEQCKAEVKALLK